MLHIVGQGCGDAGKLGRGSFEVHGQTGILSRFCRICTKGADGNFVLFEVGEVLQQRSDTAGTEEDEHVIIEGLALGKVVAYGTIHNALGKCQILAGHKFLYIAGVDIAYGHKELFGLVLYHLWQQVVDFTRCPEEHLTLAVLNIFLDIEGYRFGDAEILHILRDNNAHLLAQIEEVVDGMARCENDGRVVEDGYLLRPEFPRRKTFYFDERTEYYLYAVFFLNIEVRRLVRSRLGL